jgi:phage shock protein PspC (stress-responsive transcriptional regulator)
VRAASAASGGPKQGAQARPNPFPLGYAGPLRTAYASGSLAPAMIVPSRARHRAGCARRGRTHPRHAPPLAPYDRGVGRIRDALRGAGYVRPRRRRVLAGVCAGLAQAWGVRRWVVRLGAVLSVVLPGPQILLYIVLWILMPEE